MEKELLENENIENIDAEVDAARAKAKQATDEKVTEVEWSAVKKTKRESENSDIEKEEEARAVDKSAEAEELPKPKIDTIAEPEVKVAEVEDIGPIEEYSTDTKTMAKIAKKAGKEARREAKENTPDYEDDGSILKAKSFRQIWDKICLVLLVVSIALPVGLLVYIIMHYFL